MTPIRVLNPTVDAAPGDIVVGNVEIHNDGTSDATYRIRVVGTGSESTPFDVVVPAGETVVCEIPIQVASTLGIGQHATAYEVTSSRPGEPAVLSPFTLSIASVDRVELIATPATIRARRRASFHLDVTNNEELPVSVEIDATAPDVAVSFTPDHIELAPGQRVVTTAKVKGPRHWSGEPTQHNLVIRARGRAASTSITAPYVQRPLFAHRARMLLAGLTVIALWLGAIGGVALWWSNRNDGANDATTEIVAVDTDGDGIPDAFFDVDGNPLAATDTNGDGVPDSFVDADGNPVTDLDADGDGVPDSFVDADGNAIVGVDTDGDGVVDTFVDANGNTISPTDDNDEVAASQPTSTVVRGTITAADDLTDVQIALAPIALGAAPPADATVQGFAGAGAGKATKIWSARFGRLESRISTRLTQPVPPVTTTPEADGIWLFSDVALGQSYELVFSKPGFDTQSYVITPPSDGSPIELDVELAASVGALAGRVSGPNGGLGGATVTVTDGTITFETTSATDGNIGSWSIEGLSTPAVYTVSAELRGFGTQVLQVALGAGQERSDANLSMQPGVGSVSGIIRGESGEPLGGVTVTATDGTTTRTTTSLTEGNIGFFNIPQLDVPGTYTVTVELDGFVTQTRRIVLGGALGGIDFNLVSSSLRLTGRVTSTDGRGIVAAGVTLSTGDLEFRVPTAAAPDAGAFVVDDLPPGLYTITFDHYQHVSATEMRTLVAGQQPAPVNVTLETSSGPPAVGTGSLRVEVIDPNAIDPIPREVRGAKVQVYNLTSGELVGEATQEANNFRFDDLPIGTYSVTVSADNYNTASDRIVTLGLQERSIEVFLQRLGAASGSLIDPTDAAKKFSGYIVDLYLDGYKPGDLPIIAGLVASSEGVWQTSSAALPVSTYVVVIRDTAVLDGYIVRGDQVLDPAAGGPMRFVVPVDVTEPIVVDPIIADPYPQISGNVYRADSATASGLFAIDNQDLAVTMSCPGGTDTLAAITDTLTVVGGNRNDTYTFTREEVDRNQLTGDCTLTFEAPGYATVTHAINGVQPSVGPTRSDRRLNAALTAPAPDLRGTVFWRDLGESTSAAQVKLLPNVTVSSDRTVAYSAESGSTLPQAVNDAETVQSNLDGTWSLPGQIFGSADYNFTEPRFDPAVVTFTITESGLQTPTTNSNAAVTGDLASGFAVEMKSPGAGSIAGSVTIETSGTPKFADVDITATDPAASVLPTITPTNGQFSIDPARAGTWTIDFQPPANHDFFDGGQAQLRPFVDADTDVTGIDTSLVELGTLELTLEGVGTPAAPITDVPTVELTPTPLSPPGAQAVPPTVMDVKPVANPGDPANTFVLDGIKVATTNPATVAVGYTLAITLPNYDTSAAQSIPITVRAGDVVQQTVALPSYGTVSGSVAGSPDTTGTTTVPRPFGTDTKIQVTPISGSGGTVTGSPIAVSTSSNTYSFGGPTGWYRIDVASVGYEPTSVDIQVVNDVDATQNFLLDLVDGSIDLTVVRDLVGRAAVPGATYQAYPGACPQSGSVPAPAGVDANGQATIGDLVPGAYCITIREVDSTGELAFPAIATVMVDTSTTPIPVDIATHAPVGATTTITAPLPAIRASVNGTIRAVNSNGDPVPLPASITLEIDYAETVLEVDNAPGGTVANTESRSASTTVSPAGASSFTYTFATVPVGVHSITAQSDIAGYTPVVNPVTVTVGASGGFGPTPANDIVYEVADLDVVVDLDPDSTRADDVFLFAAGTPTLSSPTTNTTPETYVAVYDSTTQELTFSGVAPEIGNFQLSISDPLHTYATADLSFAVPVLTSPAPPADRVQVVNVPATAAKGRVTGSLSQYELPSSSAGMADGTLITLTPTGTTGGSAQTITTSGVTSTYSFDAPAGTYEIAVTRSGYTSPLYPVTLVNARVVTENLRIDKLALVTATITNTTPPSGTSVWLVVNNNPADDLALTRDGTTNNWTVLAAPGTYRYVEARAPLYRSAREPSTTNPVLNLAIGTPFTRSLTLSPRTLTVNVVEAGGTTAITNASVSISVGGTTATDSTSPYVFTSTDSSNAIPVTGTGTATVSATGKRTNTAAIADQTSETISVPLSPTVTATGSITAPDASTGDQVIWAESGADKVYGSITTNSYTISGLTNDLTTGATRSWTIKYDKLGVGTGSSAAFDVSATSTNSASPGTITVTPVLIPVTFTVNADSPAGPLVGATVTIGTRSGTTRAAQAATATDPGWAAGTVVIDVPENDPRTWTASATGYVTSATQTLTAFASRDPVTADPNATVTLLSRTLTLTVQNNDGTAAANGTQVTFACPPDASGCTLPASGNTSSGAFTFVPPIDAGVYTITAALGSKSAQTTLTVATSGGLGTIATNPLKLPA